MFVTCMLSEPHPLKKIVSRDNLYSIFSIDHILLVLLKVLYGDFKFRRIFVCYSTKKVTGRCRLHWRVWTPRCSLRWESELTGVGYTGKFGLPGVAYPGEYRSSEWPTQRTPQTIFLTKNHSVGYTGESGLLGVGYTGESGLTGVGYTGESRFPDVAYTGESLVQPSRPANALKETVP
jgi:hypothetical protein